MENCTGSVSHQLDAKNRIRIPARFRSELGKEYYFVVGVNHCIAVYSKEALNERLEALKSIHNTDRERFRAKQYIQGTIEKVEEDGQGRTVLSAFFREYAGIKKDVITVGNGDYLEIWSKEHREAFFKDMTPDVAFDLVDFF